MSFRMSCLLVEMPADAIVLASWFDETQTRMSSISLMGSIVAVLERNLYITKFILLFKVVQNVYVSWIFLGGLCLSLNNEVGGYPVGVVVSIMSQICCTRPQISTIL